MEALIIADLAFGLLALAIGLFGAFFTGTFLTTVFLATSLLFLAGADAFVNLLAGFPALKGFALAFAFGGIFFAPTFLATVFLTGAFLPATFFLAAKGAAFFATAALFALTLGLPTFAAGFFLPDLALADAFFAICLPLIFRRYPFNG